MILMVALLVLVAGFITRRVLAPRAMNFLTHRCATRLPAIAGESRPGQPAQPLQSTQRLQPAQPLQSAQPLNDGTTERLTDSDRRALDQIVRQKSSGR